MTNQPSSAFTELRELAARHASEDLERRHRNYVQAVRREAAIHGGDLDSIRVATAALLPKSARPWPQLFSALFDVEYVRGKTMLSLRLATSAANLSAPNAAEQFDYHREHWIFLGAAFLDRVDNLSTKAIRLLLRPVDPQWPAFQEELRSAFKANVREKLGRVRDPLAHELGAGVDALTPYWLPVLSLPDQVVNLEELWAAILESAKDAGARRDLVALAAQMAGHTGFLMAESEAFCRRLLDRISLLQS